MKKLLLWAALVAAFIPTPVGAGIPINLLPSVDIPLVSWEDVRVAENPQLGWYEPTMVSSDGEPIAAQPDPGGLNVFPVGGEILLHASVASNGHQAKFAGVVPVGANPRDFAHLGEWDEKLGILTISIEEQRELWALYAGRRYVPPTLKLQVILWFEDAVRIERHVRLLGFIPLWRTVKHLPVAISAVIDLRWEPDGVNPWEGTPTAEQLRYRVSRLSELGMTSLVPTGDRALRWRERVLRNQASPELWTNLEVEARFLGGDSHGKPADLPSQVWAIIFLTPEEWEDGNWSAYPGPDNALYRTTDYDRLSEMGLPDWITLTAREIGLIAVIQVWNGQRRYARFTWPSHDLERLVPWDQSQIQPFVTARLESPPEAVDDEEVWRERQRFIWESWLSRDRRFCVVATSQPGRVTSWESGGDLVHLIPGRVEDRTLLYHDPDTSVSFPGTVNAVQAFPEVELRDDDRSAPPTSPDPTTTQTQSGTETNLD